MSESGCIVEIVLWEIGFVLCSYMYYCIGMKWVSLVCFDGLMGLDRIWDFFLFWPLLAMGERSAFDSLGFLLKHSVVLRKFISLLALW